MKENALKWLVCGILWGLSPAVSALALSDIELHSHLNQPLEARVNLSGVDGADLAGLNVLIHAGGAGKYQEMVPLKHEVKEDSAGRHYIRITSSRAIREPILTFTLEVDWSGGRYSREYALLIDPQ